MPQESRNIPQKDDERQRMIRRDEQVLNRLNFLHSDDVDVAVFCEVAKKNQENQS